jgi:uncharacterized protein (DUF433 family)
MGPGLCPALAASPSLPPSAGGEYNDAEDAMQQSDRITIDPSIQHGRPVIRGTRVPVSRIVGCIAGGMSFEEIQQDFDITADDIRAALQYAQQLIDEQQHYPLAG